MNIKQMPLTPLALLKRYEDHTRWERGRPDKGQLDKWVLRQKYVVRFILATTLDALFSTSFPAILSSILSTLCSRYCSSLIWIPCWIHLSQQFNLKFDILCSLITINKFNRFHSNQHPLGFGIVTSILACMLSTILAVILSPLPLAGY